MLKATIDFDNIPESQEGRTLLYNDSWKQAEQEREELLAFVEEQAITGLVSISGDYHIQIASTIANKIGTPLMADFAVTAMSAFADFFWLERKGQSYNNPASYQLFAYQDEDGNFQPNINTTIMYGAKSAKKMAKTNDFQKAILDADTTINPGLKYFDCEHNGYLTAKISKEKMAVQFTNTANARVDFEEKGAPIISKINFNLPPWQKGEPPILSDPQIQGEFFPITKD